MTSCLFCEGPVTPRATSGGRTKLYCGAACRDKARNLRGRKTQRKSPRKRVVAPVVAPVVPLEPFVSFTPENYRRALAGGFDPLEALADATDLLLGQEDAGAAAMTDIVSVSSKKVAPRAANAGAVAQEAETPMRIETVSHAARRRGYTEDQAA